MARRPRRRPRRQNTGTQIVQIVGLVLVLVMILLFRGQIAENAGKFFSGFESEDVTLPEETSTQDSEARSAEPPRLSETSEPAKAADVGKSVSDSGTEGP